jgi:hypothetical protein
VRIVMGCLVLLLLLAVRIPALKRFKGFAYGFAAFAGALAFFNFALQYHQWSDGFVNRWELYHYQLGSKYFPELGYDGLYSASIRAQQESAPEVAVGRVRDLDSNTMVSVAEHQTKVDEVRARFSDERWQEFVADHHEYIASTPPRFWENIRHDHGYNPTPAWTFVARLFDTHIGSTPAALGFLASLDIVLMIVMLALVYRTYGFAPTCLALAIAGFGFGWRYLFIGSFLRLDWLATSIMGICMLKRERYATAGALIGYAAAVRVFPIVLLLGPGLLALKAWSSGERPTWPFRIAAGFIAILCIGFVGGSMTGRGVSAWSEFARDIQVHRETWGTNQVGMDTLFVSGPTFLMSNLNGEAPQRRTREEVNARLGEQVVGRVLLSGSMLVLFVLAVWSSSIAEAAALGIAAIFALTPASSYYWIMAIAVTLRRTAWTPIAVLALSTAIYWIASRFASVDYHPFIYALFAYGLAAVFFAWLVPGAVTTMREFRRR